MRSSTRYGELDIRLILILTHSSLVGEGQEAIHHYDRFIDTMEDYYKSVTAEIPTGTYFSHCTYVLSFGCLTFATITQRCAPKISYAISY